MSEKCCARCKWFEKGEQEVCLFLQFQFPDSKMIEPNTFYCAAWDPKAGEGRTTPVNRLPTVQ